MGGQNANTPPHTNKHHTAETDKDKFIVKYRQHYYDITKFLNKHPGGISTLNGLKNADMTNRFQKAPPHSDAAMYLMKEYKMKTPQAETANGKHRQVVENGIELIAEEQEAADAENNTKNAEDTNNNHLDDSMEHLVDWSKAMVPQIRKITKYYDEWVHKPVDRPLRLFSPWYLEMWTKTSWWAIPMMWVPIMLFCVTGEFVGSWKDGNMTRLTYLTLYFMLGIIYWTLMEYVLHRWFFHMKIASNSSAWVCTLHFMIHGLHHKVPFDPKRLVFPPLPGLLMGSIVCAPVSLLVPMPHILIGGAILGYLYYDMMHYYLHYGNPSNEHMYHMKRYHFQHHFAHQDMAYGISSPLWDCVFDTRLHLRKLKFQLRWK